MGIGSHRVHGLCVAVDVHYLRPGGARAAAVVAADAVFSQMLAERTVVVPEVPLLVGLLGDGDVAAHAVMALGRLRPQGVRPAVEQLLDHPQALVRREAKKALARLPAWQPRCYWRGRKIT
jgi:hypothetical protein